MAANAIRPLAQAPTEANPPQSWYKGAMLSETAVTHRPWLLLCAAALTLLPACGGSSSETPWPKEPPGRHVGPEGEAKPHSNVLDVRTLPVDKRYDTDKKQPSKEDRNEDPQ